jgi:predicted dehydrogenase
VLINQCPHNLDLIQWVTGLKPSRITAVATVGKTHPIEVEDEISAIIEFASSSEGQPPAIGHFIATTGEAPGTNRLEIAGDRGKLVAENGKIILTRNAESTRIVRETSREAFANISNESISIDVDPPPAELHGGITQNFVNAILRNEPLIAPGDAGIAALELGNAMQMAGLTRQAVNLPLDGEAYAEFLRAMERQYGGKKTIAVDKSVSADMKASFARQ